MADPIQTLQRLQSQRSIRQGQDRNALLQRQRQTQQLQQQIQRQQEIARQQAQQQEQTQAVSRSSLKQSALAYLARTGKANESFRALSPREQEEVRDQANDIQKSGAMNQALSQVSSIETQLGQRLDPKTREALVKETLQTGRASLTINQLTNPISSYGNFQGPVPRGIDESTFRATGQKVAIKPDNRFQGPVQRFTDPQYFAETGKKRQLPLVVSAVTSGTFQTDIKRLSQDVKTAYKQNDLPQIVRSTLGTGSSILFREGVRKTEQGLKNVGVGADSPLFKQTSFPTSRVVGDVALGSLLVGLSGSSQVAVSRYVKNGVIYELDSAGNVISSKAVSQVNKEITDFKQLLDESAVFKKAGGYYSNEANLREKTRELINRASPNQLKQLKDLYRKSGRSDLFNDILAQEKDLAVKTNIKSASAIKDNPAQLSGVGQVTSQFTGTGQYERTEMVAGGIPKQGSNQITNPMLLSNKNTAFGQSSFNIQNLALTNSLGSRTITATAQQNKQTQSNILGLRQETKTAQRTGQALSLGLGQATKQQSRLRQAYDQMLKYKQETGRRMGRPRPPTPKIRLFGLPESESSFGKTKSSDKDRLGFVAEIRRKGKFQVLGNAESTLGKALMKASSFVDVTLARSFRLRSLDTGELVSPSGVSSIFRSSKREAKTFVEKSAFALGKSEVAEIKLFKKAKRSKNVFGI